MKQVIVKKEPEELVDDSERDISINYDKPSTSSDQEMPSTSGMAIKQKIKKELHDSDNSMDYDESGVKEEPETSTDEDNFDGAKQTKLILEAKYEEFLDKGSKINDGDEECDDSDHGDESENFLYNIKEEGDNSESSVEDNKNYLYIKDEGKDENEAMFETKIEVKYHGVEYNDISAVKSGADSEVVNKNILAKIVLPKESHEEQYLKPRGKVGEQHFFKCDNCPKEYQTKTDLLRHKKYVHIKDGLEKFKCNSCDYMTVKKSDFNSHSKIHDKEKYLKCHFCEYVSPHKRNLNAHILKNHQFENKIKITNKIFQCTKCLYSTVYKSHYDNHILVCLKLKDEKFYECHICNYRTILKRNLTGHIKTHSKIKELKCIFCQYQCNKKSTLDNHILFKHSDMLNESNKYIITSKIHHCQKCKYKSTYKDHLKRHLKTHV
ncbi:unnamed protein product [Brassicogethes aeneus]|uniref:C2H2-type domain-containing protein n=1 Tax=Brassicogethes aeneus TaxID=1431903 RepID=A0A9P0B777_BRAAE|nr:unnamed protein product [Brassicogethes aeneus]